MDSEDAPCGSAAARGGDVTVFGELSFPCTLVGVFGIELVE